MLKLLRKFTPKEWALSAVAFVLILIQVWLTLTMPDYMSEITMLVQTEGSAMSDILAAGGMMLLCAPPEFPPIFPPICGMICLTKCSLFPWRRSDGFPPRA